MSVKAGDQGGDHDLAVAALDVLLSVSPANLCAPGTHSIRIPRRHVLALEAAMSRRWPGALDRARAIQSFREVNP